MKSTNKLAVLLFTIFSLTAKTTIYLPKNISFDQIHTRKADIEFAFDIHDVLVQKNEKQQKQIKHRYRKILGKKKLNIVKGILKKIFTFGRHNSTGYRMYKEIKQLQKQQATGEAFAQVFEHYHEPEMARYVQERANAQDLTPGMELFITELAKQYTLRIASNIGDRFYTNLQNKYGTFFSHFDGGTTVTFEYGKNPITKPSESYYQNHNKTYNPNGKKIILFVDDKKENAQAATKHGWVGIHIDKKKNQAQQVRTALQELQII